MTEEVFLSLCVGACLSLSHLNFCASYNVVSTLTVTLSTKKLPLTSLYRGQFCWGSLQCLEKSDGALCPFVRSISCGGRRRSREEGRGPTQFNLFVDFQRHPRISITACNSSLVPCSAMRDVERQREAGALHILWAGVQLFKWNPVLCSYLLPWPCPMRKG